MFLKFSMCSHYVSQCSSILNVFLKMFPIIAPHFLSHFVFGCGSTSMNIMVRGRGWEAKGIMTKHAIIFGGVGSIFRLPCWGVPHVPKILVMDQSNGSF
jgi:hypothetical protein